jgi:hypothetical protein
VTTFEDVMRAVLPRFLSEVIAPPRVSPTGDASALTATPSRPGGGAACAIRSAPDGHRRCRTCGEAADAGMPFECRLDANRCWLCNVPVEVGHEVSYAGKLLHLGCYSAYREDMTS